MVDKETKEIYVPTAEQYYSISQKPPYENGKPYGFLTREPSKRCQILITKILSKRQAGLQHLALATVNQKKQ